MKERKLLLLGLLLSQSLYGYQINDFIVNNLSGFVETKRSTVYSTLDSLCSTGHVHMVVEQVGNRPVRKVYTLTEKGRHLFNKLLKEFLVKLEGFAMPFETSLLYLDTLPPHEWADWLNKRKQILDQTVLVFQATPSHAFSTSINLALSHRLCMMQAEQQWLAEQIENLNTSPTHSPSSGGHGQCQPNAPEENA